MVQQKFEQRAPSGDIFDGFILFLSGEQLGWSIQGGVSSFNGFKNITMNTRIVLVRNACISLYFIHGPPVFSILGEQQSLMDISLDATYKGGSRLWMIYVQTKHVL